jgi:hypothetical protein
MSSRLARLAARLDALSRTNPADDVRLRVARWGFGLAIPLPPEVVEALALREGDPIEVRVPDHPPFQIIVTRAEAGLAAPR